VDCDVSGVDINVESGGIFHLDVEWGEDRYSMYNLGFYVVTQALKYSGHYLFLKGYVFYT
jgi:hypothetical protein